METNFNITGDINSPVNTFSIDGTPFTYSELSPENKTIVDSLVNFLKEDTDICCKLTINYTPSEIVIQFTETADMDHQFHSLKDVNDLSEDQISVLDNFLSL